MCICDSIFLPLVSLFGTLEKNISNLLFAILVYNLLHTKGAHIYKSPQVLVYMYMSEWLNVNSACKTRLKDNDTILFLFYSDVRIIHTFIFVKIYSFSILVIVIQPTSFLNISIVLYAIHNMHDINVYSLWYPYLNILIYALMLKI